MPFTRKRGLSSVLALFVISLAALLHASQAFPDYPVRPVAEYRIRAEKADITVAVEAVEDVKDQKTYFDTELTSKGYIPVFVVIHNGSKDSSFIFDKTKVTYNSTAVGNSALKQSSKGGVAIATVAASAMLLSPIYGPAIFLGTAKLASASRIQQNYLSKDLKSKTLSPGGDTHGFMYIQVPKSGPRDKINLSFPLANTGTDDTITVELTF
jgi:hypothetical protein